MPHLFSIVTSAYNSQDFILYALKSVKEQTEKDYEYIIVDNGSEDNTLELINEFIEKNPQMDIKLYHFDLNQGISGGRNAGIEKATGEYICLLDADDYWCSDKLKEVKNAIKSHPEFGVFCHWEQHIKDEEIIIGKYRRVDNKNPYEDLLFNGNCLSTSAMVIKNEMLKEINGFDKTLKCGEEDFDCWLRLARNGATFFMIEKPLGVWRIRRDSISAKYVIHTDAVVAMLQSHFDYMKKQLSNRTTTEKMQKKVIARNYCGCARTLSLVGQRKLAKEIYFKSLLYDRTYMKTYVGLVLNILHL